MAGRRAAGRRLEGLVGGGGDARLATKNGRGRALVLRGGGG